MLKKLSLSLLLFIVPIVTCTPNSDRIASLQNTLAHTQKETNLIALKLQETVIVGIKAFGHMRNIFKDDYENRELRVNNVIHAITESTEFADTVNNVTDYMVTCIVNELMDYSAITINPDNYPLKNKVDYEEAQAFAHADENTLQFFNTAYVIVANTLFSTLLLKKLELHNEDLLAEISILEAANQSIAE